MDEIKNNKFNITEVEGIKVVEFNIKYSNSMGFLKRGIQFADYAYKSIRYCYT